MSSPSDEYLERRQALAEQIARQRTELAEAYGRLEKPIRYTEHGMRAFAFLRANPWIFMAAPAAFNIVSSAFGGKKKSAQSQTGPEGKPVRRPNILRRGFGHAVNAYKLYRQVRSYLP